MAPTDQIVYAFIVDMSSLHQTSIMKIEAQLLICISILKFLLYPCGPVIKLYVDPHNAHNKLSGTSELVKYFFNAGADYIVVRYAIVYVYIWAAFLANIYDKSRFSSYGTYTYNWDMCHTLSARSMNSR